MNEDDLFMEYLLEQGAIEIASVSPTGEIKYSVTPKCAEIAPDIYESYIDEIGLMMMHLWELSLIDITMSSEGEWLFALTEKGYSADPESLHPNEQELLQNMRLHS
jgi:hypothetical protein